MSEISEVSKAIDQTMAKRLVEIVVHRMVAKGQITEDDLNNHEVLFNKLHALSKNAEFSIVIDHRSSILETAEEFLSRKQHDFSLVFFAMFFEHSINQLITHQLEKKKISKKTKIEIIKSANIEAKFSWLLEILGLPNFNESHKKTIIKASNERNAFIHYKWNPIPDTPLSDHENAKQELISAIRKSVTYIKKYESRVLYENNKGKIKRVLNKRP